LFGAACLPYVCFLINHGQTQGPALPLMAPQDQYMYEFLSARY
jgi:hypothetical protein